MKHNASKIILLVAVLTFSALFGANVASIPFGSDDLLYQYYYPEIPVPDAPHGVVKEHPIRNLKDISESIFHHYFNMNGRAPIHYVVQLFCGIFGKVPFGIASAIVLIFFIIISSKIVNPKASLSEKKILFLPVFMISTLVLEKNTWFDIACGVNYLWSSTICLAFWLFFTEEKKRNWIEIILLSLFAFLAGWSFEGIVVPLSVAIGVYVLKNFRSLKTYQLSMLVAWIIGAAFLVLAPSNFSRAGGSIGISLFSIYRMAKRIRCCYLMIAIILVIGIKSRKECIRFVWDNIDLIAGIVGGIIFFTVLHDTPDRVAYGIDMLSMIVSCRGIYYLLSDKASRILNASLAIVVVVMMVLIFHYQQLANAQRMELVAQLEKEDDNVGVYQIKSFPCPNLIKPYVNEVGGKYKWWEIEVYGWAYDKKGFDFVEVDFVDE